MRADLPTGTVTFLFSDVEGSTRLLDELGVGPYAEALAEHRRIVRAAFTRHGGAEVDTQGDAFFVAFPTAEGALSAAAQAQAGLADGPIRVRMGIHTGTPVLTTEGYVGPDVHRAARIAAAGHGGQVLISAATAGLVANAELHDLGEHRLKDLSAAERIYQAGAGEFPPLKTLYQTNLPVPLTSFLGRQRELSELTSLIARHEVRLVTLTGPGGTGKTRLALAAAGALAELFPQGIWWVPLTPLRDPTLVLATAAGVLTASGDLAEHIADRRMLLLFDNFEQVIAAATDVGQLLARCPNLQAIVTSRERLRVSGETEYAVPPLAVHEAVELFGERSGLDADDTISELCQRLDNLPLAVELAAARTAVLSPAQILERLSKRLDLLKGGRDAEARQATLRATIEWSHELLNQDEQKLFARLSVFRGGWMLDAAEQICQADLDVLQSLLDKSLVRRRGERFGMLETIREFAAEQLEESGEGDEVRQRHAGHYLRFAEAAYPHLTGDPTEWLDRLEGEHDNLRAALDRMVGLGETQFALQLAGAMWRFWYLRGYLAEGRRRLEAALNADDTPGPARARALTGASGLAEALGDFAAAEMRARASIALHEDLGDEWGKANARFMLGITFASRDQWRPAQKLLSESVDAFRQLGDHHYTLLSMRTLAWMHEELGDIEGYRALRLEHYRIARETGNQRGIALGLRFLSLQAQEEGRFGDAISLIKQAFEYHRRVGEVLELVNDLLSLADVLAPAGDARAATILIASAEKVREDIDAAAESWAEAKRDHSLAIIRARLDDDAFTEAWELGRTLTAEEAMALATAES